MYTLGIMPRIVIIVAMAIAIARFGEAVQTFDLTPESDVTGYVTGAVILRCASTDRTGTVLWLREGQVISQNTAVTWNPDRCFISGDQSQGQFFLTITELVESDAGNYYCVLSGDGGDPPTASTQCQVTVLPDAPQIFTIEPSHTTVVEGDTTVLQCAVDNKKGTIYWSKGEELISIDILIQDNFVDRFSLIGDHANGEYFLQITNTQVSDDAGYRCFVSNLDGSATLMSDLAQLIVIPVTTMSISTPAASTLADVTTHAPVTTQRQTTNPVTTRPKPTTKAPTTKAPATIKQTTKPPPTTQGPVAPGSSYPLCSLTGNNMFEDELVTIACRSMDGDPIANIEWSKEGENIEPTHTSLYMNEVVSYISLNLTRDLLGAVYTCTSTHVLYNEPKTCQVGPLEFELKQFVVEIEPDVLRARPGTEGMFECIVDSYYPVLDYVWRFEGDEINETDSVFEFDKNNTVLYVLNITKDMDESVVTCDVMNTQGNESATAIIRIGGHHSGLNAFSVAIISAISIFVLIMIILVIILFYCFWWKKRKEKETPLDHPVENGSSEVRKSTDSNLDGAVSHRSGQSNSAYVIESDIPIEKNGKLPPIRSHTPVGERPNTADISHHRSEHKHSHHRRHKKHKRKRIRPTEPKSPRSYDNGKPRVLDHFVVNSIDQKQLLEKSDETGSDSHQNEIKNHVYETPVDAQTPPSRGRERTRKEAEEDDLRPRSPTPESHRPRTGERRHRHRRSVDEIDDRAKESSERRDRHHRRRRRHRDESDDETRKSGERRRRPKSGHRRNSSPEDSDIGLRKPKKMPPISSGNAELEMKLRRTEESDIATTEHDDDTKEVRKSHSKPRRHHRSRESHERRSSSSRDRHRSSMQGESTEA